MRELLGKSGNARGLVDGGRWGAGPERPIHQPRVGRRSGRPVPLEGGHARLVLEPDVVAARVGRSWPEGPSTLLISFARPSRTAPPAFSPTRIGLRAGPLTAAGPWPGHVTTGPGDAALAALAAATEGDDPRSLSYF